MSSHTCVCLLESYSAVPAHFPSVKGNGGLWDGIITCFPPDLWFLQRFTSSLNSWCSPSVFDTHSPRNLSGSSIWQKAEERRQLQKKSSYCGVFIWCSLYRALTTVIYWINLFWYIIWCRYLMLWHFSCWSQIEYVQLTLNLQTTKNSKNCTEFLKYTGCDFHNQIITRYQ